MTREEAKQYVEWVKFSENNILKPKYYTLIKEWVENPNKDLFFEDEYIKNAAFSESIGLYKLEDSTQPVTLKLTKDEIIKVETVLNRKIT